MKAFQETSVASVKGEPARRGRNEVRGNQATRRGSQLGPMSAHRARPMMAFFVAANMRLPTKPAPYRVGYLQTFDPAGAENEEGAEIARRREPAGPKTTSSGDYRMSRISLRPE